MSPEQFHLFAKIEQDHWWFAARRYIMGRLLERIEPPNLQRVVLDVGCGTGGNIASLASKYLCYGLDTTDSAVAFAVERFPQVRFVHNTFPHGVEEVLTRLNVMLCMDVIEHIENDKAFVEMLISAMPSGSHLLISVPADMRLWSKHDVTNDHYRRYDRQSFEETWSGLPVQTRLVGYFNSRLFALVRMVRHLEKISGESYGESGTDFKMPLKPVNEFLKWVFESEAEVLLRGLDSRTWRGFRRGVSLLAILRKT